MPAHHRLDMRDELPVTEYLMMDGQMVHLGALVVHDIRLHLTLKDRYLSSNHGLETAIKVATTHRMITYYHYYYWHQDHKKYQKKT